MKKFAYKLTVATGVAAFALSGASVLAMSSNAHAADAANSNTTVSTQGADHQAAAQTRLADAKLKACQKREAAITKIITRINTRTENQLGVFDKIATRTEAFYTTKGKTLSNYDALVAAVASAKAQAETDLSAMKTADGFKCDGSDPKGMVASFKSSLKSEISDLKAYRTAVKNLIVGVKSVQGTTSSASKSPEASKSPDSTESPKTGVKQ